MRTRERLLAIKKWAEDNLCRTEMKAPAEKGDITVISRKKPDVYLAWAPGRVENSQAIVDYATSVCPGIIIMPNQSAAKNMEEQRFDRYNKIHRPKELGQKLSVTILFSVYEPGIRLPGFVYSADNKGKGLDMSLFKEGTEEGLFTLIDWMDDCMQGLLKDKFIPGSDLYVEEETVAYSLYTDQNYVVDRRPIYYGFINVTFAGYTEEGTNEKINEVLV